MTTAPTPAALERHREKLAQSEADLRRSLQRLEDAARHELDIGSKLAEYAPLLAIAGFGFGLWLGGRAPRR